MNESRGCYQPFGNSNNNSKRPVLKRQNSRLSAPTFTNVDFAYSGNSEPIHHLVKHCGKGGHSATALNFEANLRTWDSKTAPKMENPFQVIQASRQRLKTTGDYKGQISPVKSKIDQNKFDDSYREKNFNTI
jgi:hypothetical protein